MGVTNLKSLTSSNKSGVLQKFYANSGTISPATSAIPRRTATVFSIEGEGILRFALFEIRWGEYMTPTQWEFIVDGEFLFDTTQNIAFMSRSTSNLTEYTMPYDVSFKKKLVINAFNTNTNSSLQGGNVRGMLELF